MDINAPVQEVWKRWTTPDDIKQWNIPFPNWHVPKAENELRPGGRFLYRMESIDGKEGFDYGGTYNGILQQLQIAYTLMDERRAIIDFVAESNGTLIIETFEAENKTPLDIQKMFCQSVLEHFKQYVERSNHSQGPR